MGEWERMGVYGVMLYTLSLPSGSPWISWAIGRPRTPGSPRISWNSCEGDSMTTKWSHHLHVIQ